MKTAVRTTLVLLAGAAGAVLALGLGLRHRPVPVAPGPAADALAREVQQAVDVAAWGRTRALRWRATGGHEHLWDRDRGYARVRFSGREVLLDLAHRTGRAWTEGVEVQDRAALRKLLDKAYAWHVNDAFWLNPLANVFDPGVTRSIGSLDGKRVLDIHYASGGVTPGDSYQWVVDETGRPERWRIWARVLPVKGAETTWEGWTRLETGAWVSTVHRALGIAVLTVGDLTAGTSLQAVEPGGDPFRAIAVRPASPERPRPASADRGGGTRPRDRAIAARALRGVERLVGPLQDRRQLVSGLEHGDADAQGDRQRTV